MATNTKHYRVMRCDRSPQVGSTGGGVCIFVHDQLYCKEIVYPNPDSLEMSAVMVNNQGSRILFVCVYRPPSTSVSWWDSIQAALEYIINSQPTDEMIIVGDFNVNVLDKTTKSNHFTHLHRLISLHGLTCRNKKPTRWPSMSCLDLILTSSFSASSLSVDTIQTNISDHFLLKLALPCRQSPVQCGTILSRRMNSFNVSDFQADLLTSCSPFPSCSAQGISAKWEQWSASYLAVVDRHAPLHVLNTRLNPKKRPKPWVTDELRKLYHLKKTAFRKTLKNPSDENTQERFRELRTATDRLNSQLRNEYFLGRCSEQSKGLKAHWLLVNTITNRKKNRPPPLAEVDSLNQYFHSIVTDTDRPNDLPVPLGPERHDSFTTFTEVTEVEVERLLANLDPSKATGSDRIPAYFLKISSRQISADLCKLINSILRTGEIPEAYKFAHITPVYKTGDPTSAGNYRPVSLLPILSKLLEKVVAKQLSAFIQRHPDLCILPEEQFAYRAGRSTEDALTVVIDHLTRAVDLGENVGLCFVDMSKAFDRVSHPDLLQDLHECGVGGTVLRWFQQYLQGRSQAVKVGTNVSSPVACSRGVPQGSVLGPILYSIYVRNVPKLLQPVKTIQYADDICFFKVGRESDEISHTLSTALHKLNTFLSDRSLLLNATKTQVMLVSSSRRHPDPLQVYVNGQKIEQVESAKYLGVYIDHNIAFTKQVESTVAKVAGLTAALRRHKGKLDLKSRRMYYIALIQPLLEYSSNAYVHLLSAQNLNTLRVAANCAIRAVFGLPDWAHVSSLYARLHVAELDKRYLLKSFIAAYKCMSGLAPKLLSDRLLVNDRCRNQTRQTSAFTFKLPHVNTQLGLNSFSFLVADRFNGLPAGLRSCQDLQSFVRECKVFIGHPGREG